MQNNNFKILEGFLAPEECRYFIETYEPLLEKSTVYDQNGQLVETPWRTSSSFVMYNGDAHVIALKARISALVGLPMENIEGVQLLRYRKGEEFKMHHDFFTGGEPYQRVHTVFLYLNDLGGVDNGGATCFPHYGVRVYPQTGRAIWFRNVNEQGAVIQESLHAGEPVLCDSPKYAVNVWIQNKAAFT